MSGLGFLDTRCIYLINDATSTCISVLEYVPKMLSNNPKQLLIDNSCQCTDNGTNSSIKTKSDLISSKIELISTKQNMTQMINSSFDSFKLFGWSTFKRSFIIFCMIGGGVGMRKFGTLLGASSTIYWFNKNFGSTSF